MHDFGSLPEDENGGADSDFLPSSYHFFPVSIWKCQKVYKNDTFLRLFRLGQTNSTLGSIVVSHSRDRFFFFIVVIVVLVPKQHSRDR